MMTPKQALIKDNETRPESERIPVKKGRGRLSKAANDRVIYLVQNKNYSVKGYEASTSTPATASAPATVSVKKVAVSGEKVIHDFVIFYEESMYKAVALDKRVFSMRECCNNCRVSLVQCHCGRPSVLNNIVVSIVPK